MRNSILKLIKTCPLNLMLAATLSVLAVSGLAPPGLDFIPSGQNHAFATSPPNSCVDIEFIFARGSGEDLNDVSMSAWRSEITAALSKSNLALSYHFFELGSDPDSEYQYPAVPVAGSVNGIGNLLGAYVSAGSAFEFGRSVRAGEQELIKYVDDMTRSCPATQFVLGGYSQSAMLMTHTLPQLDASKIIYVSNFGDPKTYLPEGEGLRPDACLGRNLSNYRAYVSDCHAYEGVLGSYRPYQIPSYLDKIGLWCNAQDIMCSSGFQIKDHTSYVSRGLYRDSARVILDHIKSAFPSEPSSSPDSTSPSSHDLVILIDQTGSMIGLSNQYKMEAKRLARQTWSLGGRVALFSYGNLRTSNNIMYCDFSCTPEQFDQHLDKIFYNLAGGDGSGEESALSALYHSMKSLEWQVGATKSAVLLTDGTYRRIDFDQTTLPMVVALSLKIDPVNIYAITSSDHNVNEFQPLVSATNGSAYNIYTDAERAVDEITGRPAISLDLEEYSGLVGDEFYFHASSSLGSVARYDWDLDGDNIFETENAGSEVLKTYSSPLDTYIQVKLTDSSGYSSTMSARLSVHDHPPKAPTVDALRAAPLGEGKYQITFTTNADRLIVSLDDAILGMLDPHARADFVLTDAAAGMVLRLIPYRSGVRGPAAAITLSDEFSSGSSNLPGGPVAPPRPDSPSLPGPSDSQSSVTSRPAITIAGNLVALRGIVPKAPNTGVVTNDAN